MPELPEVETIVRSVRGELVGRTIREFVSHWPRNTLPSAAAARRGCLGGRISAVTRRAKYIVLRLETDAAGGKPNSRTGRAPRERRDGRRSAFPDGGFLLIHLRMSGRLALLEPGEAEPKHARAVWKLDDQRRLVLDDARKFGRIVYAAGCEELFGALGPEPLAREFTAQALYALLSRRARQLKPLLLDQSAIAGLGNIYADEALHRAGLHPLASSRALSPADAARLHAAIRDVLRTAIRRQGTSFDWIYPGGRMQERLHVYGRAGAPCRTCGTPIVALRVGQRGTHICPRCQPGA